MAVSILALAHLTITCTKQFVAKLDFISYMINNAMPPYGSYSGINGLLIKEHLK